MKISKIYVVYDTADGEIISSFTSKEDAEINSLATGIQFKEITLYASN